MKLPSYFWGFATRIGQQFLVFANTLILARFLSPEDFGKVGVLTIFYTIGTCLADTGMGGSLIKEKKISNVDCSTVFVYNFCFSVILYSIIFISSPFIEDYFEIQDLSRICRLICLPIIIYALSIVPRALCLKEMQFDKVFYITVSSALLSMVGSIVLAILGYKVWALAMYYVFVPMFETLGYYFVYKYYPRFKFSTSSFKRLFSFGLFTTLCSIIDLFYENILSLLIGKKLNTVAVGYYTQAKKIEEAPSKSICNTISNVSFPILSKLNSNKEEFLVQAKRIQSMLLVLSAPIMILIMVYAKPIMIFLLGAQWADASVYLRYLSIAGLLGILENTNRTFIKSLGYSDYMFKATIIKRGIGLLLIFTALHFEVYYLLLSYVIATLIGAILNAFYLSKLIDYSLFRQFLDWIKIGVPIILFALLNLLVESRINILLNRCIISAILLLLYFLLLPVFGVKDLKKYVLHIKELIIKK